MRWVLRASTSAASSTTAPREVLIRMAVGFMEGELFGPRGGGSGRSGDVDGDEIGLAEEVFHRDEFGPERVHFGIGIAIVIKQRHVEALGHARHASADAAGTENAERLPADIDADEVGRAPAGPLAGTQVAFAFAGAAGGGEQEDKCDLGGGVVKHAGGVGTSDAAGGAGGDINRIVEAYRPCWRRL